MAKLNKQTKQQQHGVLLEKLRTTDERAYQIFATKLIVKEQANPNGNAYTLCKKLLGYDGLKQLHITKGQTWYQ